MRKFTEEIDKARVVQTETLIEAGLSGEGEAIEAAATIQSIAKLLIQDTRTAIPVAKEGKVIGAMKRETALAILVGTD